jgi:hypothetical protein
LREKKMEVITFPDLIRQSGFRVYLGGAIDMGKAVYWQDHIISLLTDLQNLVLINPRRSDFTADKFDEQITWELAALEATDIILMWFPKDSDAPISLLETGLYMRSGKLVLGVEDGYRRQRNLELTSQYYGVHTWGTLDELAGEIRRAYSSANAHK